MSDLIAWKYCNGPCGELKEESKFPKTKKNGKVVYVSKFCRKCTTKKYAADRAEKRKRRSFKDEKKERWFISVCTPALHPYLKKYGQA